MKIKVVLLTKNEEENVEYMINNVRKYGFKEMFLVDEHSSDKTGIIAKKMGVRVYQRSKDGKGNGMIQAINIANESGVDILVFPDCDRTYNPKYIPKMLEFFPDCDLVVTRRDFKNVKWLHRMPNRFHTLMIRLLYGGRIHDINSAMRAIKVKKFVNKLDASGFDIEAQMIIRALKSRMKIKEIPIDYEKRLGNSKIRVEDGFIILWRIIKDFFRK